MMGKIGDTVRGFWHSVKPDSQLFKGIEPGVSTDADVRRQAGEPDAIWQNADGSHSLEYPRGPEGLTTWRVTIGADDRVRMIEQLLTAANFAKVHAGMTQHETERLLGKPTKIEEFSLRKETVWGYRWQEQPNEKAFFNVHFGPDGRVTTTSRSDDPTVRGGG